MPRITLRCHDLARKSADQKNEFLEKWEKQLESIESQEIRDSSAARRADAQAAFAATHAAVDKAQAALVPLMQQLRDIRASLTHDLSPAGVSTIAPVAQKAAGSVKSAKAALSDVSRELTKLARQITPAKQPK